MSKKNATKGRLEKQQDFVCFEPEPFKLMPIEKMRAIREYFVTFRALRDGPKTAKEIHKDVAKLGQKISSKTIYRHLIRLEEHGFAAVVGYRQKKGTKIPVKLYNRTAHLFFMDPNEEIRGTPLEEEAQLISEAVAIILQGLYQTEKIEGSALNETVFQFLDTQRKIRGELVEKAIANKELAAFFTETEIERLNFYADIATMIATFLRHPKLLEQFNRVLNEE